MAANYLHGVETIELSNGVRPVRVVKSSVIGLVGTSPIGPRNTLTLVQNAQDAAVFGSPLPGFSIPKAIADILAQGSGGPIVVVNVFDPATHVAAVSEEEKTVTGLKFKLTHAPISGVVVAEDTEEDPATYVLNEDYTFDAFGNFTILPDGDISEGDTVLVSYNRADFTSVNAALINGTFTAETGVRTGMEAFDLTYNTFGFVPRILIAPGYSTQSAVAAKMLVKANKYRAHALIDAPIGTTPAAAVTGRGPLGAINFNVSDKRAVLCYPHFKAYDIATDASENRPYSQFLAGVIARIDLQEGYWNSPSNKEVLGVTGIERTITAAVNDPFTEANVLNENGIVTVFSSFGTGYRTWGNRSAAFPSSTAPGNFIAVQRVADIVHESLELAMLQFIDKPITNAVIDSIRESCNAFMRTLIQRGALVDGICSYDPAKNTPAQVAAGQLTFDLTFMPPTPAERITFESFIDINLLQTLGQ
jgi:phage tail sheath protein FI